MRGLAGHGHFDIANGEIAGLDLARILPSGPPAPRSPAPDESDGTIDFDAAQFSLHIDKGVAAVNDGKLSAAALAATFGGNADLGSRSLDLWALVKPAASGQSPVGATPLRLKLTGPWDNAQIELERDGAKEP
jgi:uncharacterized protein involved in outer membrane biogenesis